MDKFVKLTRAEMKEILGGVAVGGCYSNCSTDADCGQFFTCQDDSSSICPNRKTCS